MIIVFYIKTIIDKYRTKNS